MKILAHTSFIGTTGYANHARSFFCALNKHHTVKVRNFPVPHGWKEMSNTPFDDEPYITSEMKDMLILQTLWTGEKTRKDFPMYDYKGDFEPDVHIILIEQNHHYYYEDYDGYKIGFCVWESTRFPEHFFNRLHYFDEMWVPTQWQADSLAEQGYPKEKISIVPEGVDVNTFKPIDKIPKKNKFRFLYFGRWDYRKSTTEVLRAFGETFKDNSNVELIASVENPYPYDETRSTEERMDKFDIHYDNIKYVKFVPREEYVKYLQEGDVFLSCARSEGWNLPLIEAMSCGIPALYSNWGGQLQFAQGKGVPVEISHLRSANIGDSDVGGKYCEPDFMDLQSKMIDVYRNYEEYRNNALLDAATIHENFNWERVAKDASGLLIKTNLTIDEDFHNSNKFYTDINKIVDFTSIKGIEKNTMDVATTYGWHHAVFHEIYNLQDYYQHRKKKIHDGDIVVDVGANMGVFTRWAYQEGASKVFAFEPDKRYFKLLQLNSDHRTTLFNAAVSDSMEPVILHESDHFGGSNVFHVPNSTVEYEIEAYTLDYLFESGLVDKIDFLKVDIEGGEINAFKGISDENLKKVGTIGMEYHHRHLGYDEELRKNLIQRLRNLGFDSYILFLGTNNALQMLYFSNRNPIKIEPTSNHEKDLTSKEKYKLDMWCDYYEKINVPMEGSTFAQFCLPHMNSNDNVLDVCCGNGRDSKFLNEQYINVSAFDIHSIDIPGVNFKILNLEDREHNFSYDDKSFDSVYGRFVLHAVPEILEDYILINSNRVLKDDGLLFIEARSDSGEVSDYADPHYRRLINIDVLIEKLTNLNFVVEFKQERDGLSIYKGDNPVLIRIIARKKGEIKVVDIDNRAKYLNPIVSEELLFKVKYILDSNNITFLLLFGTLLGAYRDNGFIIPDTDIDLGLFKDDMEKVRELVDEGYFAIYGIYDIKYQFANEDYFLKLQYKNDEIDFYFFQKTDGGIYEVELGEGYYSIPSREIDDGFSEINFLGETFLTVNNIEEYLTRVYGEWKTPSLNAHARNDKDSPSIEKESTIKNVNKGYIPKELNVTFFDKPRVEILDDTQKIYNVEFINLNTGKSIYETKLSSNRWCEANFDGDCFIIIDGIDNDFHHEEKYSSSTSRKLKDDVKMNINFIDGPFVEILNDKEYSYHIEFIDLNTNKLEYEVDLKSNHWARASKKYYVNWIIKIKGIDNDYNYDHIYNPIGRRVLIGFESKSLGDTLAWIPYVEKFRMENNCHVVCSTFHNRLFKGTYPNIEFVEPGSTVPNVYSLFRLGIFRKDGEIDFESHNIGPKTEPLTKVASDILGLDYIELKPLVPVLAKEKKKVVSIATHATAQSKYWNNPTGWQEVVDYIVSKGYEVKLLSREEDGYMGNKNPKNVTKVRSGSIENIIKTIQESELFIGLSSGLSWVSWAVGTETILISGFTDDYTEPLNGIRRIINKNVCYGCWSRHNFDPGDWNWCPDHKGTDRQFECTKTITSETVIEQVNLALGL